MNQEKWIILPNGKKITNPLSKKYNTCYNGPINNYMFNAQQSNYDKLKELIDLTHIVAIHFDRINTYNKNKCGTCTEFVAYNHDKSIVWHKYESSAPGSGDNRIYINGIKYKTTKFLSLTLQEVNNILSNF